jgi:hypothetical protein
VKSKRLKSSSKPDVMETQNHDRIGKGREPEPGNDPIAEAVET